MELFILGVIMVGILLFLSVLIIASDENSEFKVWSASCIIFLVICVSAFVVNIAKDFYYEKGQVDVINDNIRYELVKRANGELYWKLKK